MAQIALATQIASATRLAFLEGRPGVVAAAARAAEKFHDFKARYGRRYAPGSEEHAMRFELFARKLALIEAANARPGRSWVAGVNPLSDRTREEFRALLGWRGAASPSGGSRLGGAVKLFEEGNTTAARIPAEFMNWTKLASAQRIRDQGSCGSCWAVATATILEAHSEIAVGRHKRRSFSVQDIVSCVPNPNNCGGQGGCTGATVELALNWVMHHGAATELDVPYAGVTGVCKTSAEARNNQILVAANSVADIALAGQHFASQSAVGKVNFGMTGWERLPENQYKPLLRALMAHGPVGVSVSADPWTDYLEGIFDDCKVDAVIDHAVVLTGFGLERASGMKYYVIQNSWGPDWGERGSIRLLRKDSDERRCGTDRQPEVGTGCDGGPKEVTVCGMCGILYDSSLPHFGKPGA